MPLLPLVGIIRDVPHTDSVPDPDPDPDPDPVPDPDPNPIPDPVPDPVPVPVPAPDPDPDSRTASKLVWLGTVQCPCGLRSQLDFLLIFT
jgi:hypothetical protein